MSELTWSWLSAPYFACAIALAAVAITGAVIRGDRVMRLGVVGAATTAIPWAVCSGLAACADDADTATRFLRLGQGPIALVGPNLLLVLLGVSGQLERRRWIARIAGALGATLMGVCWATDWIVPSAQRLSSGIWYPTAGPMTDFHFSQLAIWLGIGLFLVRRSTTKGERRRMLRMLFMVLALGTIGSIDLLMLHGIWGGYPIAWLAAMVASLIAMYLVLKTDLVRPQGVDPAAVIEAGGFALASIAIAVLSFVVAGTDPVSHVLLAALAWGIALAISWIVAARRPAPAVASERALAQFAARVADAEDERVVGECLAPLWKTIGVELRTLWRHIDGHLADVTTGAHATLDADVAAWLVAHAQPLAAGDLATMRLGPVRGKLEALVAAHGATLIVPLIDRASLVGFVEADHADALREAERGLVVESARAAARALTYVGLARAAAKEGELAREVELAEAMRRQASASRDDELGRWSVAAEYRSAPRSTGATWSAMLLADGRLAVLVTEAQRSGVPAALATAALTGAFAAATTTTTAVTLDELVAILRTSAAGVMRRGEPIAAFLAVLDADRASVAWSKGGAQPGPGAHVIGPVAYDLSSFPLGSGTGKRPTATPLADETGAAPLPADALIVIASSAVRGPDEARWQAALREQAPAGPRLASVLVEMAARRGDLHEDFLAVVVRQRPDRRSEPAISR